MKQLDLFTGLESSSKKKIRHQRHHGSGNGNRKSNLINGDLKEGCKTFGDNGQRNATSVNHKNIQIKFDF